MTHIGVFICHMPRANKVIEHFNKLTVQEQQEIMDFLRSL